MENKKPSFLVVEDDPSARISYTLILEGLSECQIDYGENGKELIEKASEKQYNVIITDNNMPEKTGLEALIEIRKSGNRTPMIMITGKPTEELKEYEKNPDNLLLLLEKPADANRLESEINKYLDGQRATILS